MRGRREEWFKFKAGPAVVSSKPARNGRGEARRGGGTRRKEEKEFGREKVQGWDMGGGLSP